MRRKLVFWMPFIFVGFGIGAFGLRQGYLYASLTETDVINAYAAQYLADRHAAGTGGAAAITDCVAYPAAPEDRGVWLIISCGPTPYDAARHYEYAVNRMGRLVERFGPETWGGT